MKVSRVLLQKNPDMGIVHGNRQVQVYCSAPFLRTGRTSRLVGVDQDWSVMDVERAANRFLWTVEDMTRGAWSVVVADVVEVPQVLPTTDIDGLVVRLLGLEQVVVTGSSVGLPEGFGP